MSRRAAVGDNETDRMMAPDIENGKLINIYLHQTGTPDIFDQYNWNASMRGGRTDHM